MIGVFLLIGIVKKNAIMMIDFAIDFAERNREHRAPATRSRRRACSALRPIMMTTDGRDARGRAAGRSGSGFGSELRRPLGIAIVGGLLVSQVLTLYTTPVVYLYVDRGRLWFQRHWSKIDAATAHRKAAARSGAAVAK